MADPVDVAIQQEILLFMTTEHSAQQTARSSTIQEANGRASLFLTAVSSATVALAFVGQVCRARGKGGRWFHYGRPHCSRGCGFCGERLFLSPLSDSILGGR